MKTVRPEYPPSHLIDKDTTNFGHSQDEADGTWVRVYLEQFSRITRIVIHNREHACCQDRIVGLTLYIKSGDKVVSNCGTIENEEDKYVFDCAGSGDEVELSKTGSASAQNIAEIMVYGYPGAAGKWAGVQR